MQIPYWDMKDIRLKSSVPDDLVDFIGSDAHNLEGRKMNLGKCAAYVRKKMGQDYAEEIFIDNPRRIWKSR